MARVVIAGGGVIGLASAWELAGRGWSVTLVEGGRIGQGASHGNDGWVVPSFNSPVPGPGFLPRLARSIRHPTEAIAVRPEASLALARWLWAFRRFCTAEASEAGSRALTILAADTVRRYQRLQEALREPAIDIELRGGGVLYVYLTEAALADTVRLRGSGESPVLDGDDVRALEPALSDQVQGGYADDGDHSVRPDRVVAGLRWLCEQRGVVIREGVALSEITSRGGMVHSVTAGGDSLELDALVLATGADLGRTGRLAGLALPVIAANGYSLDYAPPPQPVRRRLYFSEARIALNVFDDFVRLGGTLEFAARGRTIREKRAAAFAASAANYLRNWPADLSAARPIWGGARPVTPDGLPLIGWAPRFGNLAIAGGHAMLGMTLAPVTGALIGQLLDDGRLPDQYQLFDPARFQR